MLRRKLPAEATWSDSRRGAATLSANRQFNFVSAAIVLLAIVIVVKTAMLQGRLSPSVTFVATALSSASVIVLLIAAIAVWANLTSIVDWFRIRVPSVIHDEVLGDLTYRDGTWSAHPDPGASVWMFGRRSGPDPALVRAGSEAWTKVIPLEAAARSYAERWGVPAEKIGPLRGLQAEWTGSKGARRVLILVGFKLIEESDVLDVIVRDGEPIEVDIH